MEALAQLEKERGNPAYLDEKEIDRSARSKSDTSTVTVKNVKRERIASREMCTFLILNISSLQLIPVNMIAYRQQYGSVNPAGIIAPAIVATAMSTLIAITFCKVMDRKRRV